MVQIFMSNGLEAKIDYLLNNEKGKKILEDSINYLIPLITNLSENRLTLGFTPLFMAMVLSSEYVAERSSGSDPTTAFEAVKESLTEVCRATERLLSENWENGSLEEFYNRFLESLSSGKSGSEQTSFRNE